MPMHWLDDYYLKGAWNIKKPVTENRDQMQKNTFQLLQNIEAMLKGIQKRL